jgi:UDP-N-acetylglucosamine/UDP-N-acetyl-alpha-D-glucosaminouronate 4-epimerase
MRLVTGGGGFIGSHLARALVQRGEQVRVLDNGETGGTHRLADVIDEIEWVDGDIRDRSTVERACAGVDTVFHHAAIASVPRSVEQPQMANDVNVNGTLNVLAAATVNGVRRVVFASSSAVYGDNPETPKHETLSAAPTSPYGVQKLAAEMYVSMWPQLYGLETVSLRYFNVYGPGQDPQSDYAAVIPRFIAAAIAGAPITIHGSGEQSRDFININDVIAINLLAATSASAVGAVLNVGTGRSVTVLALVDQIGRALSRRVEVRHGPSRPGDIFESVADITRLRSILGYEPQVSFADGIASTVDAYLRMSGSEVK